MLITVFTPTYNRAHLLPRLYESLCNQTFKDFEWIIVDDGSTDNTEEVVQSWLHPAPPPHSPLKGESAELCNFPIYYIKKENGGKHRAINRGVQEAQGELFFIVDSDDKLPADALERIAHYLNQIKDDNRFAGVCGLKCYFEGKQVGGQQDFEPFDCSLLDIRQKYHIKGDMAEVVRTNVFKEFPFPEIENERFCPEALVWNRIAQKYVMRYFHENIYECEYQPDGLTAKIVRIRMDSPLATVMTYQELNSYDISFIQKLKAAINYWRFRFCARNNNEIPKLPWYWNWIIPFGFLMHLKDKQSIK